MLNKVFLIFLALMLSGCLKGTTRPSSAPQSQYQAPAYPLQNKQDITLLQQRLSNHGYNPGPIDGDNGPRTKKAIRQFQQANGFPVDGLATTRVLQQLEPGYVAPSDTKQPGYNDEVIGESTAIAAGVGAIAGAAIGAIVGGKEGALIGGAAGGAVGAATDVGANVFRVNQAETEHSLNLSIDQVRQENKRLKGMIDTAKKLIREDKAKMAQIKRQLAQQKLTKKQAKQQYAELNQNRQLLQQTYNDLLAKKKEWQEYANNSSSSQDMDQEIKKLNTEIASLKIQLDELDQLRSISITG